MDNALLELIKRNISGLVRDVLDEPARVSQFGESCIVDNALLELMKRNISGLVHDVLKDEPGNRVTQYSGYFFACDCMRVSVIIGMLSVGLS